MEDERMAEPKTAPTVAIVGASSDRAKFGNKAVRAYLQVGYTVFPIHPRQEEIEGLRAYPNLQAVPAPIDRVSMYVPPKIGVTLLEEIARCRPKEFYLNPGSESPELVERARALGLEPIEACSILAVGMDPDSLSRPPAGGS
jgi:predicted CoA-binding protein